MGLGDASFAAEEYSPAAKPSIVQVDPEGRAATSEAVAWRPICKGACEFAPEHFNEAMLKAILQPNLLTSWLFRAEMLFEGQAASVDEEHKPLSPCIQGLQLEQVFVRRLIPRNTKRDKPMVQSCPVYREASSDAGCASSRRLVLYLPHVQSALDMPFYHPQVQGVGLLYEWDESLQQGTFSIHYQHFEGVPMTSKLQRTALNMLTILHKLGQGEQDGYVKRVHHDKLIPQTVLQDRYSGLRDRYARDLVTGWLESTDPVKHVFEDLGIAAFLIELWADMYREGEFPGFVDIGAGNGLLVHILNSEGFRSSGWGFDARSRKSWVKYNGTLADGQATLQQLVLVPSLIQQDSACYDEESGASMDRAMIHDGVFPKGTFVISNHADELTPWTPLLAAASECPFLAIPCCSHNFTGARFRAPPPKDKTKSRSTYSSLVSWVSEIAVECGWDVELEILRIPSTRNTGIVGRRRAEDMDSVDLQSVIARHGGAGNYYENALKLVKSTESRGH